MGSAPTADNDVGRCNSVSASYDVCILIELVHFAAEDWQKFAFPASEVLLYDVLLAKGFDLWQCLSHN
jgi:hypothetical protein